MSPPELKYTRDHEWIRIAGDEGRVGITDYAQKQLGDIVFLELPEVGKRLARGQMFGSIESVKAVSELFSPMSGEVIEVNTELARRPEALNHDPYNSWLIALKLRDPAEAGELLDQQAYGGLVKE